MLLQSYLTVKGINIQNLKLIGHYRKASLLKFLLFFFNSNKHIFLKDKKVADDKQI